MARASLVVPVRCPTCEGPAGRVSWAITRKNSRSWRFRCDGCLVPTLRSMAEMFHGPVRVRACRPRQSWTTVRQ